VYWVRYIYIYIFHPRFLLCRSHFQNQDTAAGSLDFTWCYLISLDFTWFHFISLDFTWFHLVSFDFVWFQLIALDCTWFHFIPLGITGTHWNPLEITALTGTHSKSLNSLELVRIHCILRREKGKAPAIKGKREAQPSRLRRNSILQPDRTHARTNKMKQFPGWCPHPQPPIYVNTYDSINIFLTFQMLCWPVACCSSDYLPGYFCHADKLQ